jgi:hypothetical protein
MPTINQDTVVHIFMALKLNFTRNLYYKTFGDYKCQQLINRLYYKIFLRIQSKIVPENCATKHFHGFQC